MLAKPIRALELNYPMVQFLLIAYKQQPKILVTAPEYNSKALTGIPGL